MNPDAFYEPLDDARFQATSATMGPWDPGSQHAGPPTALLGRAVQRCSPRADMRVVRISVEILGPVPVGEVTVHAEVARPGRRVELVTATLEADGRPTLRATAWRMLTTPGSVPPFILDPDRTDGADRAVNHPDGSDHGVDSAGHTQPPPLPQPSEVASRLPGVELSGYFDAVEWRFVDGGFDQLGPAQVWTRLRIPLVAGEQPSGLCRALVVADSGNGISAALDLRRWLFINTDLTVTLHRHPAGEWVHMRARTTLDPDGVGVADSVLSDAHGRVGRGLQSLLVARRDSTPGRDSTPA